MGRMTIKSNKGASGSSTTSWDVFENLLKTWVAKNNATVIVKEFMQERPTSVEAIFPDGITRWAQYSPSQRELEMAREKQSIKYSFANSLIV